jgi:hypothetical protein
VSWKVVRRSTLVVVQWYGNSEVNSHMVITCTCSWFAKRALHLLFSLLQWSSAQTKSEQARAESLTRLLADGNASTAAQRLVIALARSGAAPKVSRLVVDGFERRNGERLVVAAPGA